MNRPLKLPFLIAPALLAAWLSFACGQLLRKSADAMPSRVRVSAMPETHFGGLGAAKLGMAQDTDSAQTFLEVLRYVKTEYVDRIDDDRKLGYGAVRTMVVSLDDPKTRFYDPAQRKLLIERLNGEFHGIGATLAIVKQTRNRIDQRRLAVVAPAPGGPADRAGIRPGDVITEVDGQWIIAYDTRQDLDHLRGGTQSESDLKKAAEDAVTRMRQGLSLPKALGALSTTSGRKVTLTLERAGQLVPIRVTLTTDDATLHPVEYRELGPKVGYLRVTQFNDRAAAMIGDAIAKARGRALVLDLRDNAGGPVTSQESGALAATLALLKRLMPAGPVATIVRPGGKSETLQSTGCESPPRLTVLVNSGTCNIAELVAAALRDRRGATILGERTFGDATWQKLFELREGAAITVTAGKIVTAKGADFSGRGITPDEVVETAGPKWNDLASKRAAELLEKAL